MFCGLTAGYIRVVTDPRTAVLRLRRGTGACPGPGRHVVDDCVRDDLDPCGMTGLHHAGEGVALAEPAPCPAADGLAGGPPLVTLDVLGGRRDLRVAVSRRPSRSVQTVATPVYFRSNMVTVTVLTPGGVAWDCQGARVVRPATAMAPAGVPPRRRKQCCMCGSFGIRAQACPRRQPRARLPWGELWEPAPLRVPPSRIPARPFNVLRKSLRCHARATSPASQGRGEPHRPAPAPCTETDPARPRTHPDTGWHHAAPSGATWHHFSARQTPRHTWRHHHPALCPSILAGQSHLPRITAAYTREMVARGAIVVP